MTKQKEEEKRPAVERPVPIVISKPPYPMEPPPTARRKFSEESFNMNFIEILEQDV